MRVLTVAVLAALALSAGAGATNGASRNGLIVFARCCGSTSTGIYVIAHDGSGQHRVYRPKADDAPLTPAWSPDGKQIAFVPGAPTGGLWLMQANGARPHRIAAGKGDPGFPTWLGNGRQIIFSDRGGSEAGSTDLYVVSSDGTGLRRLTSTPANESMPAWAPNGREIVYARGRDLWRMQPDGTGQRLLLRDASSPSWSPGGTHLAFVRGAHPWIASRSGAGAKRVADVSTISVAWSPDGRWLVTAGSDRGDLMLMRTDGSRIQRLTHESGYFPWPSWQRVGS